MSESFIKISVIIVLGAILVITIKSNRPEMSFLILVATSAVALSLIIKTFYPFLKNVVDIYEKSVQNKSVINIVLKSLVISYMAEFCGNTCRDFGLSALAQKAELVGKCAIFALSVPLINSILQTTVELMKI